MIATIDFELLVILVVVVVVVVKLYLSVKHSIIASIVDIIEDIRPNLVVIVKARIWNSLPNDIKNAPSFSLFKRVIKPFLRVRQNAT